MSGSDARHTSGFTLINLIVIVVIIAFLAAMLMPTLCRSSEQANRIKCASNLKQIGLSLQIYMQENGGKLPRTLTDDAARPTPVFYTGASAVSPFATDGPKPNDVTAAIYLLLRTSDISSEVLCCPSSVNERSPADLLKTSNFADPLHLSYSYQNPYCGDVSPRDVTSEDFALTADINPGGAAMLTVTPDGRRADIVRTNSPNHAGDGQNVLYGDGHVDWNATPFAGAKRTIGGKAVRDNVYLAGGPGTPMAAAIESAPADGDDSILLPGSPTGPASGAIAVQRIGGVREIVWLYAGIALAAGVIGIALVIRLRRRRGALLQSPTSEK